MTKKKSMVIVLLVAAICTTTVACSSNQNISGNTPAPTSSQQQAAGEEPNTSESGYPSGAITVVCSWAAGGQADTVCRIYTNLLSEEMGVPVVVENVTGNGGQVAAIEYMQEDADGYTLLYTSDVIQYLAPRVAEVEYDPAQMIPLCTTASNGFGVIVNSGSGITDLAGLKKYADEAGSLTVGVTGRTGAITYELLNALFKEMDINAEYMVFDNGPAVALEVVGGHIDCGIAIDPQCDQYVQDGSVNYIASFLEDGHPVEGIEVVPSVVSQGYDITCANPNMFAAKAGTDQAIIDTLTEALKNCQADFEAKCKELNYTPDVVFDDDLAAYLEELDSLYESMASGS